MKHRLPIKTLNKIWRRETGLDTSGVSLIEKCVVALTAGGVDVPFTKAGKYQAVRDLICGRTPAPKKERAPTHNPPKASTKKKSVSFYASWEWKKVRYESLKIHGQRCQCCGWRPGDTDHGYLVVDHINPRIKFPGLELDVSNTQILCNDCNMGKSNIHIDDYRTSADAFSAMVCRVD